MIQYNSMFLRPKLAPRNVSLRVKIYPFATKTNSFYFSHIRIILNLWFLSQHPCTTLRSFSGLICDFLRSLLIFPTHSSWVWKVRVSSSLPVLGGRWRITQQNKQPTAMTSPIKKKCKATPRTRINWMKLETTDTAIAAAIPRPKKQRFPQMFYGKSSIGYIVNLYSSVFFICQRGNACSELKLKILLLIVLAASRHRLCRVEAMDSFDHCCFGGKMCSWLSWSLPLLLWSRRMTWD